jgi:hypothetical protein
MALATDADADPSLISSSMSRTAHPNNSVNHIATDVAGGTA